MILIMCVDMLKGKTYFWYELSVNVIQEQDAISLTDKAGCSECRRPMADKMADFALETQGM